MAEIEFNNPGNNKMAVQRPAFLLSNSPQALTLATMCVLTVNTSVAADKYCLDYATVGESKCQATESTPVIRPASTASQTPQLVPPPNDVDKFLDNYGKPPREFVEFYLHPTTENAAKWAAAYQQIVQKSKDISKAWGQADQLYQAGSTAPTPSNANLGAAAQPVMPVASSMPATSSAEAPVFTSFGGLTAANTMQSPSTGGIRTTPISLTYYFSQVCPYCAKTTPDLAVISKDKGSTLTFTCVDVTPVGPQSRPDEAFITSKLPCKWRLPEEGEVEKQAIRLTPTMIIQKEGSAPVRLSGYVPLAQLRQYF